MVNSINIHIQNNTSLRLRLNDWNAGKDIIAPLELLNPYSEGNWDYFSSASLGGVEGYATYHAEEDPNLSFTFKWNNPFVGKNSYDISLPPGYEGSHTEGSGSEASVVFTIKGPPAPPPSSQAPETPDSENQEDPELPEPESPEDPEPSE